MALAIVDPDLFPEYRPYYSHHYYGGYYPLHLSGWDWAWWALIMAAAVAAWIWLHRW